MPIEDRLKEILATNYGIDGTVDHIDRDTALDDLSQVHNVGPVHGDILEFHMVIFDCEAEFHVDLPDNETKDIKTFGELLDLIQSKLNGRTLN